MLKSKYEIQYLYRDEDITPSIGISYLSSFTYEYILSVLPTIYDIWICFKPHFILG